MQKRFSAPAAIALTLVLSTAAFAAAAVPAVVTKRESRIHLIQGRVRSIDVSRLVVAESGRRETFVLTPETERIGNVRVGATVDVSYHRYGKERIASAVVARPWRPLPARSR